MRISRLATSFLVVTALVLCAGTSHARISISAYSYCKQEFGKKSARTQECMDCLQTGHSFNKVNGRWVCGLGGSSRNDSADDDDDSESDAETPSDDSGAPLGGGFQTGLLHRLLMLLLDTLAAASFITGRWPRTREFLEKLAPVQGVAGTLGVVSAVGSLLAVLFNLRTLMSDAPLFTLVHLGGSVVLLATGLVLGIPWFAPFIKHPGAAAGTAQVHARLEPVQVPLGITCAALGLLQAVLSFF